MDANAKRTYTRTQIGLGGKELILLPALGATQNEMNAVERRKELAEQMAKAAEMKRWPTPPASRPMAHTAHTRMRAPPTPNLSLPTYPPNHPTTQPPLHRIAEKRKQAWTHEAHEWRDTAIEWSFTLTTVFWNSGLVFPFLRRLVSPHRPHVSEL